MSKSSELKIAEKLVNDVFDLISKYRSSGVLTIGGEILAVFSVLDGLSFAAGLSETDMLDLVRDNRTPTSLDRIVTQPTGARN